MHTYFNTENYKLWEIVCNLKDPRDFLELREVSTLKHGQGFGEQAILSSAPRLATIKCKGDCVFGVIDKQTYSESIKQID